MTTSETQKMVEPAHMDGIKGIEKRGTRSPSKKKGELGAASKRMEHSSHWILPPRGPQTSTTNQKPDWERTEKSFKEKEKEPVDLEERSWNVCRKGEKRSVETEEEQLPKQEEQGHQDTNMELRKQEVNLEKSVSQQRNMGQAIPKAPGERKQKNASAIGQTKVVGTVDPKYN